MLLRLAKGGASQSQVAAVAHASKRDVGECARVLRERGLTYDQVSAMTAAQVDEELFPKAPRVADDSRLRPDVASYVERKKRNRKLPLLELWGEYVREATEAGRDHYAYSTFCEMVREEAERSGARRHFVHVPGAKAYIDWAGDVAHLTDRLTGRRTKVYVFVLELPFSNKFWAEGFCDMRQDSWQLGHMHAFEHLGGVPELLIPDNAPTASNHSAPVGVTLLNEEYERFADHYGTAVLPARVRKPRDKSTSESTVNLVETWIVAPSEEMTFHTLEDFNEFCAGRVAWLNARPFAAKEGSRDSVYEQEEREHMMPLPPEPYERGTWSKPKVAPDYHVQVDYMRYSTPWRLIGRTLDAKSTSQKVYLYDGGELVATHPRLRGGKGQHGTDESHMPPAHLALDDPWSSDRFLEWARRIGPECASAIGRLMSRHKIVQQSFVACRNILGLAKPYTPDLLERACAQANQSGAYPTYTGLKNRIKAMRAEEKASSASTSARPAGATEAPVDRARSAGRTSGAEAYRRRKGE